MQERRIHPRYRVKKHVAAGIEVGNRALFGRLLDMSAGGFRLLVPEQVNPSLKGTLAVGEIVVEPKCIVVPGKIAHISPHGGSTAVGFAWDPTAIEMNLELNLLLKDMASARDAGAVKLTNRKPLGTHMQVLGHLGMALFRDFFSGIRKKGVTEVDMTNCRSIDSAGVGLLVLGIEAGVKVVNCTKPVRDILAMSGVCKDHCAAEACNGHQQIKRCA